MTSQITRRRFLSFSGGATVTAVAGGTGLLTGLGPVRAASWSRVDAVPTEVTRTWLGPPYWANRLVDWRLHTGRFECLTAGAGGRTIGVLTRSIAGGNTSGSIVMRTGTLATGAGFSGFLLGAGSGQLDWRAAALVMGASGQGGGFLAVYDSDGRVRFREHTDEAHQFAFAVLPSSAQSGPHPARSVGEDVTLQLDIAPTTAGRFDLTLTATATLTGALLSMTKRAGVPDGELVGGLSLISSTLAGGVTARHWMRDLQTDGAKLASQNRAAGPVLATQYSLNGAVLKLSAQFMPIGSSDTQQATLMIRPSGTTSWTTAQTVTIGSGFCALFRVPFWDASRAWDYQVVYGVGTSQESVYAGQIQRDPTGKPVLTVALVNCTIHSYRSLDKASRRTDGLPGETPLGLYTKRNLYFPYAETVSGISHSRPDLLVALGDQYYENRPTAATDPSSSALDVLSRYYLWLLAFRDLTRTTPTVSLVDDHDVYQPNLWGWSGRAAPRVDYLLGGYVMPASWINTVQLIQCAHNPDAYDPTPVDQGVSVYYSAFSYGGVSFAVLEDRKFKNTNRSGLDEFGQPLIPPRDLLGSRQESFLAAWARMHPGQPKVCFTQTMLACVQTSPDGSKQSDSDSNGTPSNGRRTAVTLLQHAGALVLSGDQHLGSLVRHGISTFTDGPVQFCAPAAGTAWQRWFQPAGPLPHASGPNTGDFTDGFGNNFRVLAVANPKITFAEVRAVHTGNNIGDRNLKREGYGIVDIDKTGRAFRIHCWPWNADPAAPGAAEYSGWPYTLPFSAA